MKTDQPSSTALFVARAVWWVTRQGSLGDEVPAEMANLNHALLAAAGTGGQPDSWGSKLLRWRLGVMQRFSMRGFFLHVVLRKRRIAQHVELALESGARQLVVVGAGYDTLGLQLARQRPELGVFEVDHPATQSHKASLLRTMHPLPANLTLCPLDLTKTTLGPLLHGTAGFDRNHPTVFVAEGLLMYLAPVEVQALLQDIEQIGNGNKWLVFTYMVTEDPRSIRFQNSSPWVNLWLKWKGESFLWGIDPEQVASFLSRFNWHTLRHDNHQALRQLLRPSNQHLEVAEGENVVLAHTEP